ncbi:MAG: DUF362 domain-containing protein [Lachnospiraceae bacterium]|nr:DUF362 domain-containing protein [Lachnospiraceae bacterium]
MKRWIAPDQTDRLKAPVSAAACSSYDEEEVRLSLRRLLDPIDALDFVREGMTVAVKVNLITMMAPEKAATTHPALVGELCRMLCARGAAVIIGDSPGGTFNEGHLRSVYRACGLEEMVQRLREEGLPVCLNDDFTSREAVFMEAASLKTFEYTAWLDRADAIIDFAKLKTHAMMAMTCSVKNLFGTIPGTGKPECHMRFPDTQSFADLMIDLNEFFTPVLNIVDGVDAMEGNGPTAGTVRHMGILLASRSPYNLDMACAGLIGLDRSSVPTLEQAYRRGLGPAGTADLTILGKNACEKARVPDFQLVSKPRSITFASGGVGGALFGKAAEWIFSSRPQVHKGECIKCGKCAQVCPAKAIHMEGIPVIDRSRCIHCFCCQEFCPQGAMRVHLNPVGKLIRHFDQRQGERS